MNAEVPRGPPHRGLSGAAAVPSLASPAGVAQPAGDPLDAAVSEGKRPEERRRRQMGN